MVGIERTIGKLQRRTPADERGSSVIQATIVLLLMFIVFFGVLNIGLTYYSISTVQTQIQGAIARIDVTRVLSGIPESKLDNPNWDQKKQMNEALKNEILKNSKALVADNLIVKNTTVTKHDPITQVGSVTDATARVPAGEEKTKTWADTGGKFLYSRNDITLQTEVTYYVPMIANVPMMGQAVLHQSFKGDQCLNTRIEIFR